MAIMKYVYYSITGFLVFSIEYYLTIIALPLYSV